MISEEMEMLISRCDDGDLTDSERARLEAALKNDQDARRLLAEYRRLNAALDSTLIEMDGVDLAAFSRSLSRSLSERHKPGRAGGMWRRLGPVAAAAATILVGIGALWLSRQASDAPGVGDSDRPIRAVQTPIHRSERTAVVTIGMPVGVQAPAGEAGKNGGEIVWCVAAAPGRLAKAERPFEDDGLDIFFN